MDQRILKAIIDDLGETELRILALSVMGVVYCDGIITKEDFNASVDIAVSYAKSKK